MKPTNFLFFLFLVLAPCEYLNTCGPKGVCADYGPYCSPKMTEDQNDRPGIKTYYKQPGGTKPMKTLTANVRYDPPEDEKLVEGKKIRIKEEELCKKEVDTVKEAAAKWQSSVADKKKKSEQPLQATCKPFGEKVFRLELANEELKSSSKRGTNVCAECEQCELQVKANGDGVALKCKECREVPSNEVVFPAGNNRRIIKLP